MRRLKRFSVGNAFHVLLRILGWMVLMKQRVRPLANAKASADGCAPWVCMKAWLNAMELNVHLMLVKDRLRTVPDCDVPAQSQFQTDRCFLVSWGGYPSVVSLCFLFFLSSACGALVSVSFVYYYSTKPKGWCAHCVRRRSTKWGKGHSVLMWLMKGVSSFLLFWNTLNLFCGK